MAVAQWYIYGAAMCAMRCGNGCGAMKSPFGKGFRCVQFYTSKRTQQRHMADNFKKIDKRFLLTDSSVNSYGYRLLTAGYLMEEFAKNPIGYYMHGTEEYPREAGVLVRWEDLTLEDDKVYGKPCINLNHPRGQRTVDEVESGFLNAASFGHFVVLDAEVDGGRELKDGDLNGLIITKWYNRECSLVDVPGNYNALTSLFDVDGNSFNLSDFSKTKITMEKANLSAASLALLALSDNATPAAIDQAIAGLAAKAQKVDELTTQLTAAAQKATKAEDDLKALQATVVAKEVDDLLAEGAKQKKVTPAMATELKATFAENPKGLKALIAAMPAQVAVVEKLKTEEEDQLKAEDWDKLDAAGKLEGLKASDPDQFKALFKLRFGSDYKA